MSNPVSSFVGTWKLDGLAENAEAYFLALGKLAHLLNRNTIVHLQILAIQNERCYIL